MAERVRRRGGGLLRLTVVTACMAGACGLPTPARAAVTVPVPGGAGALSKDRQLVTSRAAALAAATARAAALAATAAELRTSAETLTESYDHEVVLQQQASVSYQVAATRLAGARTAERQARLKLARQAAADYEAVGYGPGGSAAGGQGMTAAMLAGTADPQGYLGALGVQQVLNAQQADLLASAQADAGVTRLFARQAASLLAQQRAASRSADNLRIAVAAAVSQQAGVVKQATAAKARLAAELTSAKSSAAHLAGSKSTASKSTGGKSASGKSASGKSASGKSTGGTSAGRSTGDAPAGRGTAGSAKRPAVTTHYPGPPLLAPEGSTGASAGAGTQIDAAPVPASDAAFLSPAVRAGGPPGAAPGVSSPAWSRAAGASAAQGQDAAQWALSQVGKPYHWGDAGPAAYDCSGLAMAAWAQAGVHLTHWTGYQWVAGPHVPLSQLRPGDLVFYATKVTDPATIHHVGIYIGGGRMIDAPYSGADVRIDSIDAYAGLTGFTRPAA